MSRPRFAARAAALALATIACAGPRAAGPGAGAPPAAASVRLAIPVGALELPLPAAWSVEEGEAGPGPATFQVSPPEGGFVLLLTPMWNPNEPSAPADPAAARRLAERARLQALEGAVEEELVLEALTGEGVRGWWFHATDRRLVDKPVPEDEYRNVMQGALTTGRLLVAFTLLDDGPGPHRTAVLDALRHARDVPGSDEAMAPQAFQADPAIETVPLQVGPPGLGWAVLVDLPGFEVAKPRPVPSGTGILVLARNEAGTIASVMVRQVADAPDARACRARDLARIQGIPGISGLALDERSGVARARYVSPPGSEKEASQANAHAWVARDGWCVDVHVSKMGFVDADVKALDRILATVRFGATL